MGNNVEYRLGYSNMHKEYYNKEMLFSVNRNYREALSSFLRSDFVDAYRWATFVIDRPVYNNSSLEKCKKLIPKIIDGLFDKYNEIKQLIILSGHPVKFAFQNGKFGCLDLGNELLIDFKYDFVDIRVKGNIEYFRAVREDKKYLVLLNGEEYLMAETMEELNDDTQAFVIRNNVIISDFSRLKDFPNIKVFIIDNCGLDKIPEEVALLKNLEILGLYGTSIRPLPEFIFELKELRIIDFAGVYFGALPSNIFKLKNLEKLYLGSA